MFRFKQFEIIQENAAMKVCTDSCLFGALIESNTAINALDIGAGTGLLSLMVAQKHSLLKIDAVEIDSQAIIDAVENFKNSKFSNRLRIFESSIQDFAKNVEEKYSLIFSNPPFYLNQLKSPLENKNLAHHVSQLSFEDLLKSVTDLLNYEGEFWLMLPPYEMGIFHSLAETKGLHRSKLYQIKTKESKAVFREVTVYTFRQNDKFHSEELIIYENGEYSLKFTELLKDYYLIF